MRQKSVPEKEPATEVVKKIRRATRRHFSAEDKIRIVLEGLRGEDSIAELCRREGIVQNLYYRWSKDFLEAGKKRLAGDTARAATSDEVKDLRREASALKEVVVARLKPRRSRSWLTHWLLGSVLRGAVRTTARAPWTSKLRRCWFPRFEMPISTLRSPLENCRGTRPTQAARCRPFLNSDPSPIAATIAVGGLRANALDLRDALTCLVLVEDAINLLVEQANAAV